MSKDTAAYLQQESPPPPSYRFKEPWSVMAIDNLRRWGVHMLCVGGSGALSKTAVAPLTRVKILLQVQPMGSVPPSLRYRGLWDALVRIPQQEGGILALYRGNGANVLRLMPDCAFKYAMHDQMKVMFSSPDGSHLSLSQRIGAAATTGVLRTLALYPFDLAQTRITADTSPAGARRYCGLIQTLNTTRRDEGIRACWKGMGISLPGVVLYTAASLALYDELKAHLPSDQESRSAWWYPWAKMGCGAGASLAGQTVAYPIDTVRRRIQINGAEGTAVAYRGYVHCLRHTLAKEGASALFRGFGVNCVRIVPGAAVQFMTYDALRVAMTMADPTSGAVSPL